MRVLITADTAAARGALRSVIAFSGHKVFDSVDLGAGALLAQDAWDFDVLVAGLFASRPSLKQRSAVLVEIGIALGRGTPVLLLTSKSLPVTSLLGLPRIEASLEDLTTLTFKLDLYLQGVEAGIPRKSADSSLRVLKQRSNDVVHSTDSALEREVAELLGSRGSVLFQEVRPNWQDGRPDLAFYLEGQETELGLVLVEIKRIDDSTTLNRQLRNASMQLARYVTQSHAGLGIVIYDGVRLSPRRRALEPLVVTMPLTGLREELESRTLVEVVRRLRNEAIHGL